MRELFFNFTTLIALSTLSVFVSRKFRSNGYEHAAQGILFGATAVLGMIYPYTMETGLFFDGRSILVSVCSLYYGFVAGAISFVIPVAFRIYQGGPGANVGILVLFTSFTIGILFRLLRRAAKYQDFPTGLEALFFGFTVHAVMAFDMLLLPANKAADVLNNMGATILIAYPLTTVILSQILTYNERHIRDTEQLFVSKTHLDLAFDASIDSIWDWHIGTDKVNCSPEFAKMLGYTETETEYSFSKWLELIHPDDLQYAQRSITKQITTNESLPIEIRFKNMQGEWQWILVRGKVVAWDSAGKPTRMVGTHVNIHRRKHFEESVHHLTQILEHSDSIAVMKDASLRYVAANKAYFNLVGIRDRDSVIGKTDAELFAGVATEEEIEHYIKNDKLALQLAPGEIISVEETLHSPTGKRTFLTKKFPIYDGSKSKIQGVATLASEITKRKQMEEELAQAKATADAANRAKSEFIANMSHELRTPLNGIVGMLQLLEKTSHAPEQQVFVEHALNASRRLTRLLSDILDLSRIEAGKLTIQSEPFTVAEVMDAIDQLFRPAFEASPISLECYHSPNIPAPLMGDSARIVQVLSNLVGNALKFTQQGAVTIEAYPLPTADTDHSRVMFVVSDTGPGITNELLTTLFTPFVQGAHGYTKSTQGAGLGLSISQKIVSLMGGEIRVDTKPGEGTTVCFSITFARACAPCAAQPHPVQQAAHADLNILIVDDDATSLMAARHLLTRLGHTCTTTSCGAEALEAVRHSDFDVILMDIQMPEMDGVEASCQIRAKLQEEGRRCPHMIALTAYAMQGDKEYFLANGLHEHLSKPVDFRELQRILETLPPAALSSNS